jgi:hypothetical protein
MAKLRTEMRRMPAIDLDSPSAVLRWLTTIVSRERFSSSFRRTFADFERAWRSGERALSDHRFWTGWTMALEAHRPDASSCPLEVVCDEWGVFQLIDATTEVPLDLASAVRGTDLPPPLRRLIRDTEPIFLVELDWGIWRWAGIGSRVTRAARAALIFEKSISRRRLVTFDLAPVTGAPGWAFTRSVEALLPWAERQAAREDDLLDIRISGPPQVDGRRLGRPAFPVVLTVSECGGALSLAGKGSDEIDLVPSGPNVWLARAHRPLQASLRVRLDAAVGHGRVERALHLSRSALTTDLDRPVNSRYHADEQAMPASWAPTWDGAECLHAGWAPGAAEDAPMRPEMADVIEYLAARPGPHRLGSLLNLLENVIPDDGPDRWDVVRALFEGGVLRPLRVRGWRGRAVVAEPPRMAIARNGAGWRLSTDGLVNEIQTDRLLGAAGRLSLTAHVAGIRPVQTWPSRAPTASRWWSSRAMGLPAAFVRPDLAGLILCWFCARC